MVTSAQCHNGESSEEKEEVTSNWKYQCARAPSWIKRPDKASSSEEVLGEVETPSEAVDSSQSPLPPLEGLPTLSEALPTLGDLPDPQETPSLGDSGTGDPRGLREPSKALEASEASKRGRGAERLKEVYEQDLALERQLRNKNIMQLADGSYIQARPDGAGGVELIPVDASRLDRMRTDVSLAISQITSKSLEVQMDTIVKKVGFNPSIFQSFAWCMAKVDEATGERYFPEGARGDPVLHLVQRRPDVPGEL